jgi:hypothetical protein
MQIFPAVGIFIARGCVFKTEFSVMLWLQSRVISPSDGQNVLLKRIGNTGNQIFTQFPWNILWVGWLVGGQVWRLLVYKDSVSLLSMLLTREHNILNLRRSHRLNENSFIVIHQYFFSEWGFVPNVLLIFRSCSKSGNYYDHGINHRSAKETELFGNGLLPVGLYVWWW